MLAAKDVEYKITVLYFMIKTDRKWVFMGEIMLFLCLIQAVNGVLTDLRLLAEAFQTAAQTDWVCPGCALLLRQTSLQKSRWKSSTYTHSQTTGLPSTDRGEPQSITQPILPWNKRLKWQMDLTGSPLQWTWRQKRWWKPSRWPQKNTSYENNQT